MSFTPRTRETIRGDLIAALTNRYSAQNLSIDASPGSDAYMRADALAVVVATIEQQSAQQVLDAFPDTASDEALARHAAVYAIVRRPATPAVLTVRVNGTPSAVVAIPSPSRLAAVSGSLYAVNDLSVTLDVTGMGFVSVTAISTGSAGNLATGAVLAWVSTPAGLDPTGTSVAIVTYGEDIEDTELLRARLLARLRQRPASGNAEDWRNWIEDCDGVTRAYVYPLLQPVTVSGEVLGCVTVVALGPAQGQSGINASVINEPRRTEIKGYIEGTHTASGALSLDGTQLRPATIASADYAIDTGGEVPTTIFADIKTTTRYPFAFAGSLTIDGASTSTSLVVLGDHAAKTGKRVLCRVPSALHRGMWQQTELKSGVYDGVSKTTFAVALASTPTAVTAYASPANWEAIRSAIFDLCDSLGPRDTVPPRRWPTVDVEGPDTLYNSAIVSALLRVAGNIAATVTTPSGDAVPANAKQIIKLDELLITETP